MIYLIDGHNLLHHFKSIRHRIHQDHLYVRDYLISHLLTHFRKNSSTKVFLYFDNNSYQSNLQQNIRGITVKYSRPDKTADDLIKSDTRKFYSVNDTIVVVSDDHGITNVVRGGNIYVKSSKSFYASLIEKEHKPLSKNNVGDVNKLSDKEVDNWLDIFNSKNENNF